MSSISFTETFSSIRDLDSLFIELVDSARTIEVVEIDSVELNRVYNKELYPFDRDLKRKIKNIKDSLAGKPIDKIGPIPVNTHWR